MTRFSDVFAQQQCSVDVSAQGYSDPPTRERRQARLAGVDLARGLAVFGMFVAHIGPLTLDPQAGAPAKFLASLGNGHASILFAVLAGVSLALLTGGSTPHTGMALRADRIRIAVRAVLLFVLGMALTQLGAPMMVILSFYGLYFLLVLPVLKWRPVVLAALAALWAIAGPLLSFLARIPLQDDAGGGAIAFTDLTTTADAGSAVLRLFLTGAYPVLTWMPFVLAGLAIGRLDLRSSQVRRWLGGTGVVLAGLGYGASWIALYLLGGLRALEPLLARLLPLAEQVGRSPLEMLNMAVFGTTSTNSPALLLLTSPHSGTPFEIVGSFGCGLTVLAVCLSAGDWLGRALTPLTAVGALALTAYTLQGIALMFVLTESAQPYLQQHPWLPLIGFVLVTALGCGVWRALLGRGPLEWALHSSSTGIARRLVRSGD